MTATRTTKSPQQRAEERLGVAQRHLERLTKERDKLQAALDALTPQIEAAEERLEYVAANPDLPQTGSLTAATATRINVSTGATE